MGIGEIGSRLGVRTKKRPDAEYTLGGGGELKFRDPVISRGKTWWSLLLVGVLVFGLWAGFYPDADPALPATFSAGEIAPTDNLAFIRSPDFENGLDSSRDNLNEFSIGISPSSSTTPVLAQTEPAVPDTPAAPTVTRPADSGDTVLDVSWTAPTSTSPITHYEIRYRQQITNTDNAWRSTVVTADLTSVRVSRLQANTTYEFGVRAITATSEGEFSVEGTETTANTTGAPISSAGTTAISVTIPEQPHCGFLPLCPTGSSELIAADLSSIFTDPEGGDLTLRVDGTDMFSVNSAGKLLVETSDLLDHDSGGSSVKFVLRATDIQGNTTEADVVVTLTGRIERPQPMGRPKIAVTSATGGQLQVTWQQPLYRTSGFGTLQNSTQSITKYELQWRLASDQATGDVITIDDQTSLTTLTYVMTGLTDGTEYEIRMLAYNEDGGTSGSGGEWSSWARENTPATGASDFLPVIADIGSVKVREDAALNTLLSDPITATDNAGNQITNFRMVDLESRQAHQLFALDANNRIYLIGTPDHESLTPDQEYLGLHRLRLTATDSAGRSVNKIVEIDTIDVLEQSSVPTAVTLTPQEAADTIRVDWQAPSVAGKTDIIGYDLEYRQGAAGTPILIPVPFAEEGSFAVDGLTGKTAYDFRLRANNAESLGLWSAWQTATTSSGPQAPPTVKASPGSIPNQTITVSNRVFLPNTAVGDLNVYFEDPNDDPITYVAEPDDATVATVAVSGSALTITGLKPGSTGVEVTASDANATGASLRFTVTVPDRPPFKATDPGPEIILIGGMRTVALTSVFEDPDGDTHTYEGTSDSEVAGVAPVDGGVQITVEADATAGDTATIMVNPVGHNTVTATIAVSVIDSTTNTSVPSSTNPSVPSSTASTATTATMSPPVTTDTTVVGGVSPTSGATVSTEAPPATNSSVPTTESTVDNGPNPTSQTPVTQTPATQTPATQTPATQSPTTQMPNDPTATQPTMPPNTQPSNLGGGGIPGGNTGGGVPSAQPPAGGNTGGGGVPTAQPPTTQPPSSGTGFSDSVGTTHEDNINRLAESGITRGCNPPTNSRFCPDRAVTRGEMATFMVRSFDLAESGSNLFADDNGNTLESNINAFAAAGITRGCNPPENTRYCPDRPVTRAQMATFLARAMGLAEGSGEFDDTTDSPHANDINRIASVGITRGCNPPTNSRYCPDRAVTRGEMATFLIRAEDIGSS